MAGQADAATVDETPGHLTVPLAFGRSAPVSFQFGQQNKRIGPAFLASAGWHAVVGLGIAFAIRYSAAHPPVVAAAPEEQKPSSQIVWIAEPGPGGGGGGGGNRMKEPPRQAQMPGKDKITVPVAAVPKLEAPKQTPKNEPDPVAQLVIPAKSMSSGTESLTGLIDAPPGPPTVSQGEGTGGGAGTGTGTGVGPGTGSGLGPGSGGGTGGGVYRIGSGVTPPVEVQRGKPQYTAEAMRARIQGTVLVECVVQPTGVCSDVQVVRSLDSTFGLDQEAVKSVRAWRFKPGTRQGEPVPVLVTIEVAFTLR